MTMVGIGCKLFGSIDFYGDVRWALELHQLSGLT